MSNYDSGQDPRGFASVLVGRPGVPWWAAVLIALVPTAVGFGLDLGLNNNVGVLAWVLTLIGVIAAALLVRRHSLFTVMVQPPLVVAAALIVGYIVGYITGGITGGVLNLGLKLVSTFPLMLTATVVAIVLGVIRLFAQPLRPARSTRTASASRI